jgi:hypothetical protein
MFFETTIVSPSGAGVADDAPALYLHLEPMPNGMPVQVVQMRGGGSVLVPM